MKKIIISIILVLLSIIAYNTVVNGYHIGNVDVFGLSSISQKNDNLNARIEEAEKLNTQSYPAKLSELKSAGKELIVEKKSYEELVLYSNAADVEKANKSQNYDLQFLWAKVGTYATKNGIKLKFEVIENSTDNEKNSKICSLKFTANGNYISVSDFIADLEKDARLSFTIENFMLVPTSDSKTNLQATFRVNDIAINTNTTSTISGATSSSSTSTTTNSSTNASK